MIITRNVDLSVGSTLGLTAYLTGKLFVDHPGIPIVVVFVAGDGVRRALLGLVNGVLVAFGKVPALVITLGTLYIYRGIFLTWAGSDRINASDLPAGFLDARHQADPDHPGADHRSPPSCWWSSATTSTPPAAAASSTRSAPTPTPPTSTASRSTAGCSSPSSSAAPSPASPASSTPPATAPSAPAPAPASSSRPSAPRSSAASRSSAAAAPSGAPRIGAFLLVTINRALPVLGISDFWQRAVVGALIIAAVVLDRVLALRQERRLVAASDETRRRHEHPDPRPARADATRRTRVRARPGGAGRC